MTCVRNYNYRLHMSGRSKNCTPNVYSEIVLRIDASKNHLNMNFQFQKDANLIFTCRELSEQAVCLTSSLKQKRMRWKGENELYGCEKKRSFFTFQTAWTFNLIIKRQTEGFIWLFSSVAEESNWIDASKMCWNSADVWKNSKA